MAWWNSHPEKKTNIAVRTFTCQTCGQDFENYGKRGVNTAPGPVMASQRRCGFDEEQAIIHYRAAISIFLEWFDRGIISEEDLEKVEETIAEKYGLPLGSIYRYKT